MQSSPSISVGRDSSLLSLSRQSSRSSLFRLDKVGDQAQSLFMISNGSSWRNGVDSSGVSFSSIDGSIFLFFVHVSSTPSDIRHQNSSIPATPSAMWPVVYKKIFFWLMTSNGNDAWSAYVAIDGTRRTIFQSCSYHEVFKCLSSFGFLWQDKEFRLAKLKAHYVYDRYISTLDALDQTNIPADAAFSIYNRLYSSKIVSPLLYFNLFNDVEKFLLETWLRFFLQ